MLSQCSKCGLSKSTGPMGSVLPQCQCDWKTPNSQRTWAGLTDEEVYEIYDSVQKEVNEHWERGGTTMMFPPTLYKAIEAKLKEKNGA